MVSLITQSISIYPKGDVIMMYSMFHLLGEKIMQPYLCEVNFSPDQGRYVTAYPQLTDDIFSTLFCDDIEGRPVKLLTKS